MRARTLHYMLNGYALLSPDGYSLPGTSKTPVKNAPNLRSRRASASEVKTRSLSLCCMCPVAPEGGGGHVSGRTSYAHESLQSRLITNQFRPRRSFSAPPADVEGLLVVASDIQLVVGATGQATQQPQANVLPVVQASFAQPLAGTVLHLVQGAIGGLEKSLGTSSE